MEPGLEPDPNVYCDSPACTRRDINTIIRLACFHCFHQSCLSSHDCCPICLVPLKKKVQKLASTFNTGLLTSKATDTSENNADIHEEECINTPASMSVTEAQSFYSSTEWAIKIDTTLNSYAPIPLPSQPNHSTHNHSSAPITVDVSASNSSPHVLTPIIIAPHHNNNNVTYSCFPNSISQSTILGRAGSNACTFIALLFSKMFFFFAQCWHSCDWESTEPDMGISDNYSRYFSREQYLWLSNRYSLNIWCVRSASGLYSTQQCHWIYYCWTWTACEHCSWNNSNSFLAFLLETSSGTRAHNLGFYFKVQHSCVYTNYTRGFSFRQPPPWEQWGSCRLIASWQHSFELLSGFKEINNFHSLLEQSPMWSSTRKWKYSCTCKLNYDKVGGKNSWKLSRTKFVRKLNSTCTIKGKRWPTVRISLW